MKNATDNLLRQIAKWGLAFLLLAPVMAFADDAAKVTAIWGKVEINGKAAIVDSMVAEGGSIKTGADGYIYLKTVDDGLLIVRPNSEARIVSYHVDAKNPTNTRIKLELLSGVARSVSGNAVKMARQNFRFNTPVAAIGVRGTDFTVFANQETTRVVVVEGGVVVSAFEGACSPQGAGPCEGLTTAELFARQQGLLLQINKGQNKPQLVQSAPGLTPDAVAPPRADEPGTKSSLTHASSNVVVPTAIDPNLDPNKVGGVKQTLASNTSSTNKPSTGTGGTSTPELANTIIWGRWFELFGQKANVDISKQDQNHAIARGTNAYFTIFQAQNTEWQVPTTGTMGFALKDSQAVVLDNVKNLESAAKLENARLQLDFAKATFTTGFDLITGNERFALQGQGTVTSNGVLYGANQYVPAQNMSVQGVVTAEKGGTAGYIFQSKLNEAGTRMVYGVTNWGKQ
ncbi:FecR family protein [Undibacterium sp. TS12]|uniref:FecR family protein n=1 Tax=Undibacterium sp. TS12 TaxID=2908202 RepID=UPI001F4CFB27|nr:FecR family protein [Undibacterium sp. TS12]MCH8621929.1 FecR family protein [Undibacterium sp. TS12]